MSYNCDNALFIVSYYFIQSFQAPFAGFLKRLPARYLSQIWPFPVEAVSAAMKKAKRTYVIENNFTGQLAGLIREQTGLAANSILKYDGRPFTPEIILAELRKQR